MITFEWTISPCDARVRGNACGCEERLCATETDILDRIGAGDEWAWVDVVVTGTYAGYTFAANLGACTFDDTAAFLASDEYLSLRQEVEQQYIDADILSGWHVVKSSDTCWYTVYKQEIVTTHTTELLAWDDLYTRCHESRQTLVLEEQLIQTYVDDTDNVSCWAQSFDMTGYGTEWDASDLYDQHNVAMWAVIENSYDKLDYDTALDMISACKPEWLPCNSKAQMNAAVAYTAVGTLVNNIASVWCETRNQRHNTDDCEE